VKLKNHRLSIEKVREASNRIDPVFLNSPQFNCESLSALLGVNLVNKTEVLNPIRSFKGRGSEILVSNAKPGEHLICASAGNFGQAVAYSCRKRNIRLTVYASVNANPFKLERMKALGAEVIQYGQDFDEAKEEARHQAGAINARLIEDSRDIETLEGAATIALELLKYESKFDAILIALGNGSLINGIGRVFKEYSPSTEVIAVQAAGAPAMIDSWQTNKIVQYDTVQTISDGIAVRIPVKEALADMIGIVDSGILVKDETTISAMQLIHQHLGVLAEPSGAVGIAALLENPNRFKDKTVATIICGGNLTQKQIEKYFFSHA
jgi:threonine dehydratase